MRLSRKIFLACYCCAIIHIVQAQSTKINNDPDVDFKQAKEFFQKEQYSLAYPVFKNLYTNGLGNTNYPTGIQTEAKYYYISCGLKLNDATAEPMAIDFIELEHHEPRIQLMSYQLAEYYFRKKDFTDALTHYNKAGIDNLTNAEIAELKFNKGYCYFSMQQFKEAKPLFNAVRQIKSDLNYFDANYYYGFINFYEKNYAEALPSFLIAATDATYQNIVPFYIAEIYYFDGERDKALQYAEQSIQKGGQFYDLPLKQLAGHLHFEKREYAQALPFLQEYVQKNEKVNREDLYELSYCYYAVGNWNKSIEGFKQLGGKEDSLAQNSMYLLADAYLKTNQKANARNAFLFCASNNSNPTQKEISSFSYAKLSYELGYLDIALKELQDFLTAYPKSNYLLEAKELEVSVLANTSNYKDALILFESLPSQTENIKKIYPRILFGRAVELLNDQRIDSANALLTRVLAIPYNQQQLQFVYFWKGEIAYRNGNIDEAIVYLTDYLKNPQVNGEVNIINAKYDLAYALLKKEDYKNALEYFQQVAKNISFNSTTIEQDAYIRAADCYFMNKNLKQALPIYENVISLNSKNADYALFQKAIIIGASNKNAEKISFLQNLLLKYPASTLVADANMEIANTYLADEDYNDAITPLNNVIKNKNANALQPQAYLKSGVAYFNLKKNDEALNNFKQLVLKYPDSDESDEAVEYIRDIFIANQKPVEFVSFMRQNGKNVSYNEEDSLTYRSASMRYELKDFTNAKAGFTDYLSKFPDGRYSIEANYFLAETNINNKDFNKALPFYNAVAARAPNKYAERSALQSARIYYFNLKDYIHASNYYAQLKNIATQQENKLEAMRGLLRCQFKLQQWNEAAANAQDILQEKGTASDDKMMASLIVAKNYQLNNQLDEASNAYKQVVAIGKSEFSAEAKYHIAEILFLQNKLSEAEKAAFDVVKKEGSYEYWVTKSYILLGDIYFKQKDLFNAEATFKSVADNASNEELKKEAQQKLDAVISERAKTDKVEQQ